MIEELRCAGLIDTSDAGERALAEVVDTWYANGVEDLAARIITPREAAERMLFHLGGSSRRPGADEAWSRVDAKLIERLALLFERPALD
jgi:hypothetical protein